MASRFWAISIRLEEKRLMGQIDSISPFIDQRAEDKERSQEREKREAVPESVGIICK